MRREIFLATTILCASLALPAIAQPPAEEPNELAQMQAAGYGSQGTLESILGYVYLNADSDGDTLIDGFESLVGTNPAQIDSDCDGFGDGAELLSYDMSSPDPAQHGFGDPLAGPCGGLLFEDDFETGSTTRWSAVAQ